MIVTRFAPSPTGFLHLGHAYSALFSEAAGDRFVLRIEDIDHTRCRPEFEEAIYEDLAWLGLGWEEPVRRQSEHFADYEAALEKLKSGGFLYPCFCTRKEIQNAASAPHGPEGPIYPGTCRRLGESDRDARIAAGDPYALRLDIEKARAATGELFWNANQAEPERLGDVVLARRDISTSYHLAVTVDDAIQGITLVTRGEDLLESTHVHRLLQALLDLPVPEWRHHPLITDDSGRRFAKRDQGVTLRSLRESGKSAADIRAELGFSR